MNSPIRTAAWTAVNQKLAFSPEGHLVRFLKEDEARRIAEGQSELVEQLRESIKLLESQLEQIESGGEEEDRPEAPRFIARPVPSDLEEKLRASEEYIKGLEAKMETASPGVDRTLRHQIALLVTDGYDVFTEDPVPEWPQIIDDIRAKIRKLEKAREDAEAHHRRYKEEGLKIGKSLIEAVYGPAPEVELSWTHINQYEDPSWPEIVERIIGIKAELLDTQRSAAEARRAAAELRGLVEAKDLEIGDIAGRLLARDGELSHFRAVAERGDVEIDQLTVEVASLREQLRNFAHFVGTPTTINDLANNEAPPADSVRVFDHPYNGGTVVEIPSVPGGSGAAEGEGSTPPGDEGEDQGTGPASRLTPHQKLQALTWHVDENVPVPDITKRLCCEGMAVYNYLTRARINDYERFTSPGKRRDWKEAELKRLLEIEKKQRAKAAAK